MRIALVSSDNPRCGIYRYTKRLVEELKTLGLNVDHLTYDEVEKNAHRYDVVHIQHEWGLMGYNTFADYIDSIKASCRRLVVTMHMVPYHMYNPSTRSVEAMEETKCVEKVCMSVHAVVTTSALGRDILRYVCGTRVVHIRHGMDIIYIDRARDIDVFIHAPDRVNINKRLVEQIEKMIDGNIYVHREFVSDEELNELLSRSKIVVLPYRDIPGWIYVSGFMYKALGYLGTVVLTTSWVIQSDLARDGLEIYVPWWGIGIRLSYALNNYIGLSRMYIEKVLSLYPLYSWRSAAVEHLRLYHSLTT